VEGARGEGPRAGRAWLLMLSGWMSERMSGRKEWRNEKKREKENENEKRMRTREDEKRQVRSDDCGVYISFSMMFTFPHFPSPVHSSPSPLSPMRALSPDATFHDS
jgi:hypothetical protein